jgi:predicted GH43/DUF377 family glycosyl hydrolase
VQDLLYRVYYKDKRKLSQLTLTLENMDIQMDIVESRSWRGVLEISLSVTCDRSVVFSTNKTEYDIHVTEILLKVALNTITLTP